MKYTLKSLLITTVLTVPSVYASIPTTPVGDHPVSEDSVGSVDVVSTRAGAFTRGGDLESRAAVYVANAMRPDASLFDVFFSANMLEVMGKFEKAIQVWEASKTQPNTTCYANVAEEKIDRLRNLALARQTLDQKPTATATATPAPTPVVSAAAASVSPSNPTAVPTNRLRYPSLLAAQESAIALYGEEFGFAGATDRIVTSLDGKKFLLIRILGDGDCGFYAAGISREEFIKAVEEVIEAEHDAYHPFPAKHQELAAQIRGLLSGADAESIREKIRTLCHSSGNDIRINDILGLLEDFITQKPGPLKDDLRTNLIRAVNNLTMQSSYSAFLATLPIAEGDKKGTKEQIMAAVSRVFSKNDGSATWFRGELLSALHKKLGVRYNIWSVQDNGEVRLTSSSAEKTRNTPSGDDVRNPAVGDDVRNMLFSGAHYDLLLPLDTVAHASESLPAAAAAASGGQPSNPTAVAPKLSGNPNPIAADQKRAIALYGKNKGVAGVTTRSVTSIDGEKFLLIRVLGDGDCGFNAAGVSREDFVKVAKQFIEEQHDDHQAFVKNRQSLVDGIKDLSRNTNMASIRGRIQTFCESLSNVEKTHTILGLLTEFEIKKDESRTYLCEGESKTAQAKIRGYTDDELFDRLKAALMCSVNNLTMQSNYAEFLEALRKECEGDVSMAAMPLETKEQLIVAVDAVFSLNHGSVAWFPGGLFGALYQKLGVRFNIWFVQGNGTVRLTSSSGDQRGTPDVGDDVRNMRFLEIRDSKGRLLAAHYDLLLPLDTVGHASESLPAAAAASGGKSSKTKSTAESQKAPAAAASGGKSSKTKSTAESQKAPAAAASGGKSSKTKSTAENQKAPAAAASGGTTRVATSAVSGASTEENNRRRYAKRYAELRESLKTVVATEKSPLAVFFEGAVEGSELTAAALLELMYGFMIENPEIYIPDLENFGIFTIADYKSATHAVTISQATQLKNKLLGQALAAFEKGQQLYATIVQVGGASSGHYTVVVIERDGKVHMINTMGAYKGKVEDDPYVRIMPKLVEALNTHKGTSSIVFTEGSNVRTGIQDANAGSNSCGIYSFIYWAALMKTQDIKAYKRVTAAASEGYLGGYEDIRQAATHKNAMDRIVQVGDPSKANEFSIPYSKNPNAEVQAKFEQEIRGRLLSKLRELRS